MNILIYTHSFGPNVGGVETYIGLLARGLARRLREIGEERREQNRGECTFEAGRVTVVTATPAGFLDDGDVAFAIVRRPTIARLWRLLGTADVVHLAGPVLLPLVLGRLRRKAIIVEHHGYQAICPNGLLLDERTNRICSGHFSARRYGECFRCGTVSKGCLSSVRAIGMTLVRRLMCWRIAAHVGVSKHVANRLGLRECQVIYHGVPPVASEACRSDLVSDQPVPLNLVYVGRLVREKGVDLLLEAAQRLKETRDSFQMEIVGDGPERAKLEAMADALGVRDRVTFSGFLHGQKLEAAVVRSDVIVMPSTWEESAGLAAIEQMMSGRVVIAADVGGLGEIVDGAGLKFKVGDVDSLVGAIRRLLNDRALRLVLRRKARERAVQLFSVERMVDEHLELYCRAAGHGSRQGVALGTLL